jgi:hypothetical protein
LLSASFLGFASGAVDAFFGGSANGSSRSIMRRVVRLMAFPTLWIVPFYAIVVDGDLWIAYADAHGIAKRGNG